jgi:hypothetical protein
MEPGKAWLSSTRDRKQRGPIIASNQGSCWGHQCSETTLTGEPGSIVSLGASLGQELLPPLPGSKRTSETVYWSEAAGPSQIHISYITHKGTYLGCRVSQA